ncbi:MAG TPA: transposase [Terrimicrobiaceae bacterium]|nr:transposase [Terrimicrobiaceae bacterium]
MARPLRCEYAGGWFHVTGRGNERRRIFKDDRDRDRFVSLLGELEGRYGLEIHGYVLMDNHYHLLVKMVEDWGLSAGMQFLGVSYSVWYNRRHQRSGHLFQGRFKAVVVDIIEWGVSLSRYIHLNPVRTKRHGLDKETRMAGRQGMGEEVGREVVQERLKSLREYRWSSYPAYCGWTERPEWLHDSEVLEGFGKGSRGRREYRKYVEEAIRSGREESPWENLIGGLVLGGEELLEKVREKAKGNSAEQPSLRAISQRLGVEKIVEIVSRIKGERWEEYGKRRGDWGRAMVLMAARRKSGMTNRMLAERLGGKDDSAVTQAVKRLESRMKADHKLARIFQRVEKEMSNVKM